MDTKINAFCSCTDLVSSTLVHIGNNKYAISSTSSNNAVDAEHRMYAFNHEMESIVHMVGLIEPGETAEIGIFAGSGNYDPKLIKEPRELKVYTPYGATSDNVIVGYVGEKKVAFLVRHERGHRIPPHKINFRANIWAMKALGVTRIISPAAVGSLQPERIKPGEFVVCDQIVSFTAAPRMNQTFFDGGVVGHVAFADPFCPELRKVIADTAAKLGMKIHAKEASKDHDSFEYVCIEGPRFSTRAESLFYKRQGWDVVGKAKNR